MSDQTDGPSGAVPGTDGAQAQAAVADLAGRLDIPAAEITVLSVEAVTWPDGSAGCPQPGMMYPQMLTEGSRILLEHDGRQYDYHSAGQRPPFLCEQAANGPFSRRLPRRPGPTF